MSRLHDLQIVGAGSELTELEILGGFSRSRLGGQGDSLFQHTVLHKPDLHGLSGIHGGNGTENFQPADEEIVHHVDTVGIGAVFDFPAVGVEVHLAVSVESHVLHFKKAGVVVADDVKDVLHLRPHAVVAGEFGQIVSDHQAVIDGGVHVVARDDQIEHITHTVHSLCQPAGGSQVGFVYGKLRQIRIAAGRYRNIAGGGVDGNAAGGNGALGRDTVPFEQEGQLGGAHLIQSETAGAEGVPVVRQLILRALGQSRSVYSQHNDLGGGENVQVFHPVHPSPVRAVSVIQIGEITEARCAVGHNGVRTGLLVDPMDDGAVGVVLVGFIQDLDGVQIIVADGHALGARTSFGGGDLGDFREGAVPQNRCGGGGLRAAEGIIVQAEDAVVLGIRGGDAAVGVEIHLAVLVNVHVLYLKESLVFVADHVEDLVRIGLDGIEVVGLGEIVSQNQALVDGGVVFVTRDGHEEVSILIAHTLVDKGGKIRHFSVHEDFGYVQLTEVRNSEISRFFRNIHGSLVHGPPALGEEGNGGSGHLINRESREMGRASVAGMVVLTVVIQRGAAYGEQSDLVVSQHAQILHPVHYGNIHSVGVAHIGKVGEIRACVFHQNRCTRCLVHAVNNGAGVVVADLSGIYVVVADGHTLGGIAFVVFFHLRKRCVVGVSQRDGGLHGVGNQAEGRQQSDADEKRGDFFHRMFHQSVLLFWVYLSIIQPV